MVRHCDRRGVIGVVHGGTGLALAGALMGKVVVDLALGDSGLRVAAGEARGDGAVVQPYWFEAGVRLAMIVGGMWQAASGAGMEAQRTAIKTECSRRGERCVAETRAGRRAPPRAFDYLRGSRT
jgi:hypothetical protein